MKAILRYAALTFAAVALALVIYLYRTVQLGRADAQPVVLENLNPGGEFFGPEGIEIDPQGSLYVGDAKGRIWKMDPGAKPTIHAELSYLHAAPGGDDSTYPPIVHAGGIACDSERNLYVAAYGFANGSVVRVDADARQVRFFARDIGVANYPLLTQDGKHLWVSDYRRTGRVLRYPLGGSLPAQPQITVSGLEYPNGLALDKDEKALYVAETYSGFVTRVDIGDGNPRVTRLINLKGSFATGSLDGLAFDPRDTERRFLYVAENIRGMFSILDLHAHPVRILKRLSMALMGGRPCPASMVIREGYLYFTDLWSCSPIRILLRMPDYRRHAYRFRVLDLATFY